MFTFYSHLKPKYSQQTKELVSAAQVVYRDMESIYVASRGAYLAREGYLVFYLFSKASRISNNILQPFLIIAAVTLHGLKSSPTSYNSLPFVVERTSELHEIFCNLFKHMDLVEALFKQIPRIRQEHYAMFHDEEGTLTENRMRKLNLLLAINDKHPEAFKSMCDATNDLISKLASLKDRDHFIAANYYIRSKLKLPQSMLCEILEMARCINAIQHDGASLFAPMISITPYI